MNDYALHQARFSGNLAGGGLLTRLIANWQARRGVASLAALDDHILRDIGVSRGDVQGLKHLPLGPNAVHVLEELARLKRRSMRLRQDRNALRPALRGSQELAPQGE